ncbi:MAG: c-type cytochrome [Gemmatimonadetes bacterium]|nr:c-type cytochrome [Gemmatimonadota bacterium]
MWQTNLKVLTVGALVLGFFTMVAHIVPQQASEVPEVLTLGAGATPEMLAAAGEKIFSGAGGCTSCHGLGTRAPNLVTDERGAGPIGARCGKQEAGKDCKTYLWEALTAPAAFVVKGYQPIMLDQRRTLSVDQIWALVAYLESNGGEVTVTGQDIVDAQAAAGAPKPAAAPAGERIDAVAVLGEFGCSACHKLKGEGGEIGPAFDGMGGRLTKDYLREAIVDPKAKVAKGYEENKDMMPVAFGEQLTKEQLNALIDYLASLK